MKKPICKKCQNDIKITKGEIGVMYSCECGKTVNHLPCYSDEQADKISNKLKEAKKELEEVITEINNNYLNTEVVIELQRKINNVKSGKPVVLVVTDIEVTDPYIGITRDELKFYIMDKAFEDNSQLIKIKDKVTSFIDNDEILLYIDSDLEIKISKEVY